MKKYFTRISKLTLGLFLYALGLVMNIHANIGLAPWEAFGAGVSLKTGITYGNASIIIGLVILLAVVLFLKEKVGIGTILNILLIGAFIDILQALNIIPYMKSFISGVLLLITAQVIISFATYFYIAPGLGCGPRDTLMVGLCKKFPSVPVGAIRGLIEGTVLIIGYLLGAKVGLGTVISVFGIGFTMQMVFNLMHFNLRAVAHESIYETALNLKGLLSSEVE